MLKYIIDWKFQLLFIHIVIGFLLFYFPEISTLFGLSIVFFGSFIILFYNKYTSIIPLYLSGYIVGIEVLFRMCRSSLFWEFGKYTIILFILLGFIRNRARVRFYFPIILYFILLLPGIINVPFDSLSYWRQSISFNLSGPACLMMVASYVYNMIITKERLIDILFYCLLPVVSMSIFIIMKMPDIGSYNFLPYSNPIMSGGFGPNQVSTVFGFMILSLSFGQLVKKYLTNNQFLDLLFLFIFIALGLITFSRGGLFAAIIAISIAFSYYFFYDNKKVQMFIKMIFVFMITVFAWFIIVEITEGAISKRYTLFSGEFGEKLYIDLTGRAQIYKIDLEIFYKNLLRGVGPGQAPDLRYLLGYNQVAAAHTEFSRMLAEHGILGLFSLFLLGGIPLFNILIPSSRNLKVIKILFGAMAILTMFHSAMRISMPCFVYGFSILNLKD